MKNNFFIILFLSFVLSGCIGVSSKGIFGTGVSVAFDPRSVGTQIDDSIMQKSLTAKILLVNKKYFLSKKDIILLDSLKSDGVKIDKKFNNLYKIDTSEIPSDLQVMINNNEKGAALLRIVEVIGQDDLERIDEDTMYFIISTLNQLDMDYIRNRILLKVLPLKV